MPALALPPWFDTFVDWEAKNDPDSVKFAGLPLNGPMSRAVNLMMDIKADFERDLGVKAEESVSMRSAINAAILYRLVGGQPPTAHGRGWRVLSKPLVRDLNRYVKHAGAVYGHRGNPKFTSEKDYPSGGDEDKQDMYCITNMCDILPAQVVAHEHIHEEHLDFRGYFISVEPITRSVVLAIRGTMLLSDVIADLVAETRPFLGGKSHAGVMRAAEQLYDKLRDRLAAEMAKRLGFRLVLTGHSLGAGVAVLMTGLLARDRAALGLRCEVKCFAYAPPPVFAPLDAFPTEASANIVCVVHRADCVPRMTLGSAFRLLQALKRVDDLELSDAQRIAFAMEAKVAELAAKLPSFMADPIRRWLSDNQPDSRQFRHLIEDDRRAEEEVFRQEFGRRPKPTTDAAATRKARAIQSGAVGGGTRTGDATKDAKPTQREYDYVFLPGKIVYLGRPLPAGPSTPPSGNGNSSGAAPTPEPERYRLEDAVPHHFSKLLFTSSAVDDHLIDGYEAGLQEVWDDMNSFPWGCLPG